MLSFPEYRRKYVPTLSKKEAVKWYNSYVEVHKASTDIKGYSADLVITDDIIEKDNMNYEMDIKTGYITVSNGWSSFEPISQQACTVPCNPVPKCAPNKKEKTMYVDNDKHIESSKINYLSGRLEQVYYTKRSELEKSFGLVDDERPMTPAEMVKRIQDGKFILPETNKDKRTYSVLDFLRWRDPSVKEDRDGFNAAMKQVDTLHRDVQDTIAIGTPADALVAIKALEAWTPTKASA